MLFRSLLADDIGIIDHGILLEEESLSELEQKSSKHIRFTLSDTAQAARILERTFHESHFSIHVGVLFLLQYRTL